MPRHPHRRPFAITEPFDPKQPRLRRITLYDWAQLPIVDRKTRTGLRIDAYGDPEKGYNVVITGRFQLIRDEAGFAEIVVGDPE